MTTDATTTKKRGPRKKKAETIEAIAAVSSACDCGEQIELLTASCKNLEERLLTLIQYIRTFNQFLNQSMISNVVDGVAEQGLTEVLDSLTDAPNPINS